MSILKRGLKGAPVKRLQQKLGVTADGDFGPGTERALKDYQKANSLAVDGIAGPDTFSAMGLHELVLLRVGSRGATVKKLQAELGIGADGIFGKGTAKAVTAFQTANGLAADGMAGPQTLAKMTGFASEVTAETLQKAAVQPDEEHFDSEPLPQINGSDAVASDDIVEPAQAGIWGKMKGWFS